MYSGSLWAIFKGLLSVKQFKIVLGILLFFLVKELIVVISLNGQPSHTADGYSEANTTRGAMYFADHGFSEYSGLGDLCYTDMFPDTGFAGEAMDRGEKCTKYIYTHYPNGSEYLATPLIALFGPNMFLVRLQPILFNFLVAVFFFTVLFTYFDPKKALVLSVILLFPPMFHNYWHGLHHQGYALSLTLLQLGTVFMFWSRKNFSKYIFYFVLFLLGFIHGWMTFDYAFIATFFSLPLFFFFKEEFKLSWWDVIWVTFWSGIGFSVAHGLHFLQVVGYYGSYQDAYNDLFKSAQFRFNNHGQESGKIERMKQLNPFSVAKDFLWRVAGRGKYTAVNLINYVWIVLGLKLVKRIDFNFKGMKFNFDIKKNDVFAVITAVFVASLWSLVMRQHAFIHGFIARHYYLVYLFCTLVLVRGSNRIRD